MTTSRSKIRTNKTASIRTFNPGDRATWSNNLTGRTMSGTVIATVPAGVPVGGSTVTPVRANLLALARRGRCVPPALRNEFREAIARTVDQIGEKASRAATSYLMLVDGLLYWPEASRLGPARGRPRGGARRTAASARPLTGVINADNDPYGDYH